MEELKNKITRLRRINKRLLIAMLSLVAVFTILAFFNIKKYNIINDGVDLFITLSLFFVAFGIMISKGIYENKLRDAKNELNNLIDYNNLNKVISLILANRYKDAIEESNTQIDNGINTDDLAFGVILGTMLTSKVEDDNINAKEILIKILEDKKPN
jgi:hypothetical protein